MLASLKPPLFFFPVRVRNRELDYHFAFLHSFVICFLGSFLWYNNSNCILIIFNLSKFEKANVLLVCLPFIFSSLAHLILLFFSIETCFSFLPHIKSCSQTEQYWLIFLTLGSLFYCENSHILINNKNALNIFHLYICTYMNMHVKIIK